MRKVILYAAMSLDGYLADKEGKVDWIGGDGSDLEAVSNWYEEFYHSVDCILMGRRTYEQIVTELSPDCWIYGGKQTYVFTHQEQEALPEIEFTQKSPQELLRWLKHRKGKDIWLCGGGDLIGQLVEEDLIDEYHLTLIPVLLGGGIPMFPPQAEAQRLKLISSRQGNGMADLVYEKES